MWTATLWPECDESGLWNARARDELERLLPRLVCEGSLDLAVAPRDTAVNWIDGYKKYVQTDRPIGRQAGVARGGRR